MSRSLQVFVCDWMNEWIGFVRCTVFIWCFRWLHSAIFCLMKIEILVKNIVRAHTHSQMATFTLCVVSINECINQILQLVFGVCFSFVSICLHYTQLFTPRTSCLFYDIHRWRSECWHFKLESTLNGSTWSGKMNQHLDARINTYALAMNASINKSIWQNRNDTNAMRCDVLLRVRACVFVTAIEICDESLTIHWMSFLTAFEREFNTKCFCSCFPLQFNRTPFFKRFLSF